MPFWCLCACVTMTDDDDNGDDCCARTLGLVQEREHALELQLEQLHLALQSSASNWLDKDQQLTRLLTSPPEGGGSASEWGP
mmetsp:Transcript_89837/g.240046  ORF Transcript_89837/g.240046 Transcript_89837/m.240046 type:complete len:82 (-) Transcript_89837:35-280(-)